jgi:homoserine kinase type II
VTEDAQNTASSQSVAVSSAQSGERSGREGGDRDQFGTFELAIVLSHYDLGIIDKIQEFPRGSRRAPKLLLRSDEGLYLLKRRARGKDDAFKVAFCHSIQLHLAAKQFPLPHLIGTRRDNNSMLQLEETIYEVFEYIRGTGYDMGLEATQDAGKTLGLFHKLLVDFSTDHEPAKGSYHNSRLVHSSLDQLPKTLEKLDARIAGGQAERLNELVAFLRDSYNDAGQRAEDAGLNDWPVQIVHSDWHPGNMLFRGTRVVAVIDFDAARLQPRVLDTANGALQFAIVGGGDDPNDWPEYIDVTRYKRFLLGYDRVNQLSRAEIAVVPWLMIEALIAEAAIPIANTGRFARMDGFDFLQMIERKVRWLQNQAESLGSVMDQ